MRTDITVAASLRNEICTPPVLIVVRINRTIINNIECIRIIHVGNSSTNARFLRRGVHLFLRKFEAAERDETSEIIEHYLKPTLRPSLQNTPISDFLRPNDQTLAPTVISVKIFVHHTSRPFNNVYE